MVRIRRGLATSARRPRAAVLIPAVFALSASAAWPQSIDLERLVPGCGGSPDDYWIARRIEDLRIPSIQWRGSENESCLVSSVRWRDGAVSARVAPGGEAAGFALRYVDADHYLGVYVDLRAGLATVKEWEGDTGRLVAAVAFDPPRRLKAARVTAAATGDRVTLYIEGRRVLEAAGATPREGAVALLAAPLCEAEVDEPASVELPDAEAAFVEPLILPSTTVGGAVDVTPMCHQPGRPATAESRCRWGVLDGSLPPGVGASADGRLLGSPHEAGSFLVRIAVSVEGRPGMTRQALPLTVHGVTWPRFPLDPVSRRERTLAVLYTPDDIGPTVTWEKLGRPDEGLFRLHRDHPSLHVTLTVCPENRYTLPPSAETRARAEQVWRDIATDPNVDWLELGGHGYTHAPDADVNLDHDEFSTRQKGCNVDHAALGERRYCERRFARARAALRRAGIPDDALAVMRFPGMEDSPEALRAAARDGYLAVLGSRHLDQPGRAWWTPLPGGEEILEIQNLAYQRVFARSEELERGLAEGSIASDAVRESAPFLAALEAGRRLLPRLEAQGGIVNLFDHWWEGFEPVGGVLPRYLLLDAWLRELPLDRVWWPSGRELASWVRLRRFARTTWRHQGDQIHVSVDPPAGWRQAGAGLEASIFIHLPTPAPIAEIRADGTPLPRSRWQDERGIAKVTIPLRWRTRLSVRIGGNAP